MNLSVKLYAIIEACLLISLFAFSCINEKASLADEKPFSKMDSLYRSDLSFCVNDLESIINSPDSEQKQRHYLDARLRFKKLEPVLGFVDIENYKYLNQPNILKIEEEDQTDIKIFKPSGFQVLEENLFLDDPDTAQVNAIAKAIIGRLKLVENTTSLTNYKDYHIFWMIRKELIRIALTGITGFDSPVLENSLMESRVAYQRVGDYIKASGLLVEHPELSKKWNKSIQNAMLSLEGDFENFNRYEFIKGVTHNQLALWNESVNQLDVEFPFELAFNNEMTTLFSAETFNDDFFAERRNKESNEAQVLLGQALFSDKRLSENNQMSCATCHKAEKAFTDGKKTFQGQNRNTPTLNYAHLQQGFFYDNRSGSLEGQIVSVVKNRNEFHTDLRTIIEKVGKIEDYKNAFDTIYSNGLTEYTLRHSISSFIRDLAPFDSKFDRSINGDDQLSEEEINGFNLFMGKAKCATCHFAPLFNGTVPPDFTESEMEMLGVPKTNDFDKAEIDPDPGRYELFKTDERKHFFKTPTIRNVTHTAPYMHNGVFSTLEEVVDFYDRGGGVGIGINLDNQTLPGDPLNLTDEEKDNLILFLHTLTDSRYEESE
ncbi:cytochrome-c peroxidase [Marinigracilibium pacificum]|uniref:Methylamine utilization protein n=1 Tax=Marinigracilibium pacificum TaxID=2729599 RepID=A0A848IW17_9BACT|nr:cytochrome c peroxidase [Marinigracilibium pacificum]NMM47465.1 methylamine utilization protein [Marinigracilibium pacificum]